MNKEIKIGMVGLDTSHVVAFTKLLNDPQNEFHVPGGKVVTAYPGGSPDFDRSASRVEGFTNQLRDDYGVRMADSIEALICRFRTDKLGRSRLNGYAQRNVSTLFSANDAA